MAKREPDPSEVIQINLRLPRELVTGIDELLAREKEQRPGMSISRSDVIRDVLYRAVREGTAKAKSK